MRNTTTDKKIFQEFYEKLGTEYPESLLVHGDKLLTSRFMTIITELKPFAVDNKSLLDLGCNDGVYTIPYVRMGGSAHGVDISSGVISRARLRAKRLGLDGISFEIANVEKFCSLKRYDVVLMSEVLEHLNNPDAALRNVKNSIKVNGTFIITAPTPLFEIESLVTRDIINFSYFKRLLRKQLKESQIIRTNDSRLKDYGLGGYLYRHDAYFPLGLRNYVESFGFKCIRRYTIGFKYGRRLKKVEVRIRKIPILNLLGITNILILTSK